MIRTVSIVIPVFNEEENLPELLRRFDDVGYRLAAEGYRLEIVLVDDHSSDRTPLVARQLLAQHRGIKYLRLSRNCGSHAASAAGLQRCTGDAAILMAADLQDPPELIPTLIAQWCTGFDVVWAGRSRREGETLSTRLSSAVYYQIMRWLALPQMPAKGADVVLLDRRVIDACNAIPEKHTSLLATILWMGFRQTSIEYVKQARRAGRSKWTLAKKIKLAVDSVVSFSYIPIRLMSVLGTLMATAGFVYAAVTLVGRLVGTVKPETGFAALMTVLLIGQGTIILMLGVLGEYLWRTYDEARGRPKYIVEHYAASEDVVESTSTPPHQAGDELKSLEAIEHILTEV